MMESAASVEEASVKSEPSLKGVCIKSETLWDDLCVINEPCENVCVKAECLSSDACVKVEPSSSDVCVKAEPLCSDVCEDESSSSAACVKAKPSCLESAGARGVSEAVAAARLYADHVVKDELVLGPELVEPRRKLCVAPDEQSKAAANRAEEGRGRACSVRLERLLVDAERRSCRVGLHTYTLRRTRETRHYTDTASAAYQCHECGEEFGYKSALRKHIHTSLLEPSTCFKKSALPGAMTTGPSKQAHPSAPEPQDTDNTCKPQTQKQKNILNPFPCNICQRQFSYQHTLNTHILSHAFKCHMCKIAFSSKNLSLNHKCCICKICDKLCASAKHKNCPKVFTCKCGEKFTRRRTFTAHQKIHVEIYGHCPTCIKQFTNETDLINHVNKMKFPCIYCGMCFPNLEELSAHNVVSPEPLKYSCKICNETFEDSLSATSHIRTHGAPMRSYSRKPKAVNAQGRRRELLNIIVNEENLSEIPIEFYKDTEPQERVTGELDDHEENNFSKHVKVKEEPCDKRFNVDLKRGLGVKEPNLKCVKVEFEVDEETRNPNPKGLGIGKPLKHIGGVKVEPDLSDEDMKEAIQNVDVVVTGSSTLHKPLRDEDMREAIEEVDGVATEESSKLFGAVKIEPEVRQEIKKEPDERLELSEVGFDEVMNEEHDLKAWPLGLSTTGLYAWHQIGDGLALGPVRVRAPVVYAGKNALRKKTACKQEPARTNPPTTGQLLEANSIKLEPVAMPEEIETVDIKSEDISN